MHVSPMRTVPGTQVIDCGQAASVTAVAATKTIEARVVIRDPPFGWRPHYRPGPTEVASTYHRVDDRGNQRRARDAGRDESPGAPVAGRGAFAGDRVAHQA